MLSIYDKIEFGDIVKCHFIDRTKFKNGVVEPYIKNNNENSYRYCLILEKHKYTHKGIDYFFITTVYGTSKETNKTKEIDEILLKTDHEIKESNLKTSTKWIFSPSNIAILPINETFFCINDIKIGKMTRKKIKDLYKFLNNEKVAEILIDIKKNLNQKMISYSLWGEEKYNINKNRDNYKYDD